MRLTTHAVAPVPAELSDLSPLVYSRRSGSLYVGLSLGRGAHYRVYNLMQSLSALTPAAAEDSHGYLRPDGRFEWDERFAVPGPLEEAEIRRAAASFVEGVPVEPPSRGPAAFVRRRLRPVRAQARRAAATARAFSHRVRPPRPPLESASEIADLSRVDPARDFLSPNAFASACRHVLNYGALSVNEEVENDWWFCKSDWLEYFFRDLAPSSPFVLFTSNSDRAIDRRLARYLQRRELKAWFAANVALEHPKLFAIPLGIGDPSERFGDAAEQVRAAQVAGIPKTRLFEVSFELRTNPNERLRCLSETGLELDPPLTKSQYLERLASAYFCIAPAGNGIDTHRVWEALYLKTIPVVTRTVLTDQHPDLPLVTLDDWSRFRTIDFSRELYARTLGDWSPDAIRLDRYLEGVERLISAGPSDQPPQP